MARRDENAKWFGIVGCIVLSVLSPLYFFARTPSRVRSAIKIGFLQSILQSYTTGGLPPFVHPVGLRPPGMHSRGFPLPRVSGVSVALGGVIPSPPRAMTRALYSSSVIKEFLHGWVTTWRLVNRPKSICSADLFSAD